jgi:hypothetical protein
MFKLLSTKFEVLFNMGCNGCLHVPHHIHSDYITCGWNDIQQFLNMFILFKSTHALFLKHIHIHI